MAQILGLMDSADLSAKYSETARRNVFYQYPNGAAPLMGLLSLMEEEYVDKPTFGWWEDRHKAYKSVTTANTTSCFATTGGVDQADDFTWTAGSSYRVYVSDYTEFRVRDIIWVRNTPQATTATILYQLKGIVTAVASGYITVRAIETQANVSSAADTVGLNVFVIGSAAEEGGRSKTGSYTFPIEVTNYTQIYRTAFSFTRTALKAVLRFDDTGVYKTKAKKNSLRHMSVQELACFFGVKRTDTVTNDDGDSVPETKTGGIEWFLKQYEYGTVGNGGAFEYRPGGADVTGQTDWETYEDKRIIPVNGTLTKDQFDNLVERAFRYTSEESFEKLCLCGSGFISAFNKYCDRNSIKTTTLNSKEDSYGMNLTRWETPYGVLYFKSHPLFNQDAAFRNDAFILDVGNIVYRPLNDSDTELLTNRQPQDFDGRKDEWLTEAGIEVRFPETHMYVKGLTGVVV